MRYYLSGPMTGLERHGFPAFFAAADDLRGRGLDVISPAETSIALVAGLFHEAPDYDDDPDWYEEKFAGIPRERFLAEDAVSVARADAVVVLPGWEKSSGAVWEVSIARKLNKSVLAYPELESVSERHAVGVVADASGAVKADADKPRVDLLPARPLFAIGEILGFGAEKYAAHNWRRGFKWSRMGGAALRHLLAWLDGEDLDQETGKSHLAHLGCDVLFLLEFEMTGTGTDDRYKRPSAEGTDAAQDG